MEAMARNCESDQIDYINNLFADLWDIASFRQADVATTGRRQSHDAESTQRKLQEDVLKLIDTLDTSSHKKTKKRKPGDVEEDGEVDATRSKRKRKKEKKTKEREERKKLTNRLDGIGASESPMKQDQEPFANVQNLDERLGAELNEHKQAGNEASEKAATSQSQKIKKSESAEYSISVGHLLKSKNYDALLKSILKDCSPMRAKQIDDEKKIAQVSPLKAKRAVSKAESEEDVSSPKTGSRKISQAPTLPRNYKKTSGTERPWYCPIDTCGKDYPKRQKLGHHMNVSALRQTIVDDMLNLSSRTSMPVPFSAITVTGPSRYFLQKRERGDF
jgi:hypothetical protein